MYIIQIQFLLTGDIDDLFGFLAEVTHVVNGRAFVTELAVRQVKYVFTCKNTGRICLFTNTGQMHTIKVLDLPYGKFRDKGTPIDRFLSVLDDSFAGMAVFLLESVQFIHDDLGHGISAVQNILITIDVCHGPRIMAAQLMFTEKQANAILEMRLYKLIGLELEALIKIDP